MVVPSNLTRIDIDYPKYIKADALTLSPAWVQSVICEAEPMGLAAHFVTIYSLYVPLLWHSTSAGG